MKRAVYPGSFDPITNGHLDVLKRALNVFDEVILLIADNPNKKSRFTIEEKLQMTREAVKGLKNVSVDSTSGLTVEYAKEHNAVALIRGLRAVTDFEYEFQLNAANHYINKEIESVFFMSSNDVSFISSSNVDEMYRNGIDISHLVPKSVVDMYKQKR